jgi:alkylated DNA repair dioxygenase AlkB
MNITNMDERRKQLIKELYSDLGKKSWEVRSRGLNDKQKSEKMRWVRMIGWKKNKELNKLRIKNNV